MRNETLTSWHKWTHVKTHVLRFTTVERRNLVGSRIEEDLRVELLFELVTIILY
jgi:hypothetical protein